VAMALSGLTQEKGEVAGHGHGPFAAWSGIITWLVYGLLALLVVVVIAVFVNSHTEKKREDRLRGAWDAVFLALKDKKATPEEQIPALEKAWDAVSGTPAQPWVALELARWHFQMARDDDREKGQQMESLKKALALYEQARTTWPNNLVYGPLACQGAGLCHEQEGDYDAALEAFKDGAEKYGKSFLAENICYDVARVFWLRSLQREKDGKTPQADEDRSAARDYLSRVVKESRESGADRYGWRQEARFLRSLLDKPGPAMKLFPDGKVPAETKAEAPKAEPKAEAKAEAPKAEVKAETPKKEEPKPTPEAKK
jgi:tetratricopeptide (TPR) repeat protein